MNKTTIVIILVVFAGLGFFGSKSDEAIENFCKNLVTEIVHEAEALRGRDE